MIRVPTWSYGRPTGCAGAGYYGLSAIFGVVWRLTFFGWVAPTLQARFATFVSVDGIREVRFLE